MKPNRDGEAELLRTNQSLSLPSSPWPKPNYQNRGLRPWMRQQEKEASNGKTWMVLYSPGRGGLGGQKTLRGSLSKRKTLVQLASSWWSWAPISFFTTSPNPSLWLQQPGLGHAKGRARTFIFTFYIAGRNPSTWGITHYPSCALAGR